MVRNTDIFQGQTSDGLNYATSRGIGRRLYAPLLRDEPHQLLSNPSSSCLESLPTVDLISSESLHLACHLFVSPSYSFARGLLWLKVKNRVEVIFGVFQPPPETNLHRPKSTPPSPAIIFETTGGHAGSKTICFKRGLGLPHGARREREGWEG